MKYLLDSNIIIRLFDVEDGSLLERIAACDEGDVVTSAVAYAEVAFGSISGKLPEPAALAGFVEEVLVLDFDLEAAKAYAMLPFRRGGYDRLIAAHALSRDLILVSDNERHFADVPGLRVENWTLPLGATP